MSDEGGKVREMLARSQEHRGGYLLSAVEVVNFRIADVDIRATMRAVLHRSR
jgi:hypothetical protein